MKAATWEKKHKGRAWVCVLGGLGGGQGALGAVGCRDGAVPWEMVWC